MKNFLLALSLVATLNQPILLLNVGSDYNPSSFWDFGYDLNYIVDHFFTGVDKGLDIIDDFADTVTRLGIDDSPNIQVTPSVKYYNQPNTYTQNNTSYYDYKSYTTNYDNRSYATTYNYDNRTYTYNPIYNDYRTYDYTTYNNYNYFEDNDYYYITNNNITNYEYYIVNKIDVNDNRYYSYYYELPSGSKSYNLTKEQVLGEFMSYDCYRYEQNGDSADVLALFKLNGNYQNEVADSDISLVYNGNSFVNGKFDGALKLDGTTDMQMIGDLPHQYTVEFWFYNNINNGTYSGCCTPQTWCHCAYTYDDGVVRVWFNGVESTRASHPSTKILPYNKDYIAYGGIPESKVGNPIMSSVYSGSLPSQTVGSSGIPVTFSRASNSATAKFTYDSTDYTVYTLSNTTLYIPNVDPNDPLHYYPQFTTGGVDFGFTGTTPKTINAYKPYIKHYYTFNSNSGGRTYIRETVALKNTSYDATTTSEGYVDMSQCLIDEIRVSNGILYNDNTFTYPQDEFTYGHVWVRPEGDDFNIGDIAIMSPVAITDYRIGGADYSYPLSGNVYVGLKNNVGYYARVYNGQNWLTCDFGVWNGSEWSDGVGFNFLTLTWGQSDSPNTPTIDVNISTDVNVTQDDKKGFTDIVGFIFELFAFIPMCIGFLTIIPTPINIILLGLIGLITVLIVIKIIKR